MVTIELLLDECRGRFIPRDFVNGFKISDVRVPEGGPVPNVWYGVGVADIEHCSDYDSEWYWHAWDDILNNAWLVDENGIRWTLYQDGSLFVVPEHPSFCFSCWVGEPSEECDNTHHEDGSVYAND